MPLKLVVSSSAESRLARVRQFLADRGRAADLVVVAETKDALADVLRGAATDMGSLFGWQRTTFTRLAGTLAAPWLSEQGLVPVGSLGVEALCARLVHRARQRGALERLAPIADFPGLPKALARTIEELRLARVSPEALGSSDVALLMGPFVALLEEAKLADRADVLTAALERVRNAAPHPLLDRPTVLLDVSLGSELEADLLAAIVSRADGALITVPAGDEATLVRVRPLATAVETVAPTGSPAAIQEQLFSNRADLHSANGVLTVFSAPGENRECVEIARIAKAEADRGVRFDRMAVLLRAPSRYRAHLEEALRRAGIPAHFARGTARPDASGRALLALVSCKLEELSATRFAEYMSLGEMPPADPTGAPPPPPEKADRWALPDSELVSEDVARAATGAPEDEADEEPTEDAPVAYGTLRAPRLWERLLVDAAVIGEKARWERRLEGLEHELTADLEQARRLDDPSVMRLEREILALASLRAFALPILGELEALPDRATWGEWIDRSLAARESRAPQPVSGTGGARGARAHGRGGTHRSPRSAPRARAAPDRGRSIHRTARATARSTSLRRPRRAAWPLDVVFIPGLAEKMFPQKVVEDPDPARRRALAHRPDVASQDER